MFQQIQIMGVLAYHPDFKVTANGAEFVSLAVDVTRPMLPGKDKQGRDRFYATIWGAGAKSAANLKEGDLVVVNGRMENNRYKDKDGRQDTQGKDLWHDRWQINAMSVHPIMGADRVNGGNRRQADDQPPSYRPGSRSPSYNDAHDEIPF